MNLGTADESDAYRMIWERDAPDILKNTSPPVPRKSRPEQDNGLHPRQPPGEHREQPLGHPRKNHPSPAAGGGGGPPQGGSGGGGGPPQGGSGGGGGPPQGPPPPAPTAPKPTPPPFDFAALGEAIAQGIARGASMTPTPAVQVQPHQKNHVKEPERFKGDKEKTEDFVYHLQLYLAGTKGDAHKIRTTLSYLSDEADDWGQAWDKANMAAVNASLISFTDFMKDFEKYFTDPQLREKAELEMKGLRIGYKETAQAFFVKFNRHTGFVQ
ncbi:hypothetical protein BKA62DRAFT_777787 [Auriculariales sp. MPI-PUGE-AT-0066]|nr:hypothetical protein BKA62DRAFT_777787 [Auriculariales sp. MPI-PUGE-AT-0066]